MLDTPPSTPIARPDLKTTMISSMTLSDSSVPLWSLAFSFALSPVTVGAEAVAQGQLFQVVIGPRDEPSKISK